MDNKKYLIIFFYILKIPFRIFSQQTVGMFPHTSEHENAKLDLNLSGTLFLSALCFCCGSPMYFANDSFVGWQGGSGPLIPFFLNNISPHVLGKVATAKASTISWNAEYGVKEDSSRKQILGGSASDPAERNVTIKGNLGGKNYCNWRRGLLFITELNANKSVVEE
jgi:hypothetical protein